MKTLTVTALALALVAPAAHAKPTAIAQPARPASEVARDATRKPKELLAFARVKPGTTVVDFIMGGGYLTRVLAEAVGPRGRIYAYQPAEFVQYRASYGTEQDGAVKDRANVTPLRLSLGRFAAPTRADVVITVQNYHDLHLKPMPPALAGQVNKALFAALKPGGTLVVVDHVAKPGDLVTTADTLHRIDPAIARREIEAAGFVFDGESALYRNPGDDYSKIVFDPAVRGRTDQFAYRFRKPR